MGTYITTVMKLSRCVSESLCCPGLEPAALAEALEQGKTEGQTAAVAAFRRRLQRLPDART
jgi:hypothetical protein